uniref:Uncharacterized protein n=1 Tax=Anguilla anguilla TaxID=7936 RepID=A0A0E9XHF8_ANGAN
MMEIIQHHKKNGSIVLLASGNYGMQERNQVGANTHTTQDNLSIDNRLFYQELMFLIPLKSPLIHWIKKHYS